jgi:type II secretory pathway pseudopilin PulG
MTLLEIMIVLAIIALVMGFLVGPKVLESFKDAKEDTASAIVKQLAHEAYPRWDADNPNKGCPQAVDELLKYTNLKENKDAWGQPYILLCGENAPKGARGGIGVLSKGPDKKRDTDDDIKSWTSK